ncbi:LytTR family DNA-binding domain-containing protein [Tannerella sp.]|uniref:LytR/AlgR family response regulator transcription factor n=1 Tax=Tannerella sp. TaxID=2382127 RepID=UPI0026DAAB66|nr:LytTR family DNA-binding domain-containing protein [Tannerella sp.]MDO4704035.1 LytTR family DNA-binding domain-containing protein [Tannerella sp.]
MDTGHPLLTSVANRIAALTLCLLHVVIQASLLVWTAGYSPTEASMDALLSVSIAAAAGFATWYMASCRKLVPAVLWSTCVQAVIVGGASILSALSRNEWFVPAFQATIPFRILFGSLCWAILLMWYDKLRFVRLVTEAEEEKNQEKAETVVPSPPSGHELERISVKSGSRIHLIPISAIFYIQACGDYVSIFTASGEYLKEQTMKYFDEHLPANRFVRIHRSCIVNAEYIARIELFGKEHYQVRLKNGAQLKVSLTGYKALKRQLLC